MFFPIIHKIKFKKILCILFFVSAKLSLQGTLPDDLKKLKSGLTELKQKLSEMQEQLVSLKEKLSGTPTPPPLPDRPKRKPKEKSDAKPGAKTTPTRSDLLAQIQKGKELKHVEGTPAKDKPDAGEKPEQGTDLTDVLRRAMAQRRGGLKPGEEEEEEEESSWDDDEPETKDEKKEDERKAEAERKAREEESKRKAKAKKLEDERKAREEEEESKRKAEDERKAREEESKRKAEAEAEVVKIDALIEKINTIKVKEGKGKNPEKGTLEREIFDKLKKLKGTSTIDDSTLTRWINDEKIFDAIEKLEGHPKTLQKLEQQLENKKTKVKKEEGETTSKEKTKKTKPSPKKKEEEKPILPTETQTAEKAQKLKNWESTNTPLPILPTTEEELSRILALLNPIEFATLKDKVKSRLEIKLKKFQPSEDEEKLLKLIEQYEPPKPGKRSFTPPPGN